jgi:hypothetical protein
MELNRKMRSNETFDKGVCGVERAYLADEYRKTVSEAAWVQTQMLGHLTFYVTSDSVVRFAPDRRAKRAGYVAGVLVSGNRV